MPVEIKFQLCNYRDGSFALLPLWFAYLVSPYGLLYLDGVTVVVLPKKATDFTLAGTHESRDRDDSSRRVREESRASEPRSSILIHRASGSGYVREGRPHNPARH